MKHWQQHTLTQPQQQCREWIKPWLGRPVFGVVSVVDVCIEVTRHPYALFALAKIQGTIEPWIAELTFICSVQ